MSALDSFKSLDIFRKLPQDLSQSTRSGALISVISGFFITLLFLSELAGYLHVKIESNMIIDQNRGAEQIHVNLDVTFHRLPCLILSLDKQDVMGTHHVNIGEHLNKYNLDKDGNQISVFKKVKNYVEHDGHVHDQSNEVDLEKVKDALKNNQGCRIQGYIDINRVNPYSITKGPRQFPHFHPRLSARGAISLHRRLQTGFVSQNRPLFPGNFRGIPIRSEFIQFTRWKPYSY